MKPPSRGQRIVALVLGTAVAASGALADSLPDEAWASYAGGFGSQRFVSARQIDRTNVGRLELAWTFRTGESEYLERSGLSTTSTFECTPLVVGDRMYLITGTNRVFALDARTGQELWVYDPKIDPRVHYSETAARGVAFWASGTSTANGSKDERIYFGTLDGRLIGLDARTGTPLRHFGDSGTVDLRLGALPLEFIPKDQSSAWGANRYRGRDLELRGPNGFPSQAAYNEWALGKTAFPQVTSPPAIVGELIIVGSAISDNSRTMNVRGVVRAYDVHNGELRWLWDPIPRSSDAPGAGSWSAPTRVGSANAWAPMTAEPEAHRIFVSTSSPSPDYYGGDRLGKNDHANSLVALDARTGRLLWSYQVVHHDLWDYDIPQQPVLLTVERDGESIAAVAVATKPGHVFVLRRDTGHPIFAVEEKPVPASDVSGEQAHPTQPFPVEFPVFGLRDLGSEDAFGRTPEEVSAARDRIASLDWKGMFTPPSLKGAIHAPSNIGGMNWGGMAWDPQRQLLITPTSRIASVVRLVPSELVPRPLGESERLAQETVPMLGSPFTMVRDYLFVLGDPDSAFSQRYGTREVIPQTPPPWGTLAAVSTQSGKLRWEVPLGKMTLADPKKFPDQQNWGSLVMGGPIATASGLVFIAGTMDPFLRAFDVETGKKLWEKELPAGAQSTPMSFSLGGQQYLAIAAGGHGKLGTKTGDFVLSFTLPKGAGSGAATENP